ncbi:hypothetical protein FACS1894199_08900 [Bacteroidia bacterium]|nr:hypothetical protein FACS1894199_08900 [Bacteroidia bacterium]
MGNTATIAVRVEPKLKGRANQVIEEYPSMSYENAQALAEGEFFFEKSKGSRFKNSAEMFKTINISESPLRYNPPIRNSQPKCV